MCILAAFLNSIVQRNCCLDAEHKMLYGVFSVASFGWHFKWSIFFLFSKWQLHTRPFISIVSLRFVSHNNVTNIQSNTKWICMNFKRINKYLICSISFLELMNWNTFFFSLTSLVARKKWFPVMEQFFILPTKYWNASQATASVWQWDAVGERRMKNK